MTGKRRKHPFWRAVLIALGAIFGAAVLLAAAVLLKASRSVERLVRLDERGALYSCDYVGNYESPIVSAPMKLLRGGGCSAFLVRNGAGEVLCGRNYDLPHKDAEDSITGLNVVVHCAPKGKYASVNVADAAWLSVIGLPYYAGTPDGGVTLLPLMFLPYLCMDGMNEKGLTVSILALDTAEGESPMYQTAPGKRTVMVNELLRVLLDSCATLEEAEAMTERYNIANTFGYDYHLFVSDAAGSSAVFEWRYNEFTVTPTDAVTNFYVGYDDACDCLYGDRLKEAFTPPAEYSRPYRYGSGHGYQRFSVLAETLESFRPAPGDTARMEVSDAMELLSAVSQDYVPGELTSFTQYSVVYNSADLSAELCAMRDYEHVFRISVRQREGS